jgi:hypothetical protein
LYQLFFADRQRWLNPEHIAEAASHTDENTFFPHGRTDFAGCGSSWDFGFRIFNQFYTHHQAFTADRSDADVFRVDGSQGFFQEFSFFGKCLPIKDLREK